MLLSLLWNQRAEFRWNKQGVQHHPNPRELNSCSRESCGCPVQQFQRHCVYFRSARVYSRSARLPGLTELGSERCFEVAPAVYTALWERCPGQLSWPQLSWSTGQHSLAQQALSPMAHRCLAHLVSLHSPPHTISVCFCPPVPSPQLSSFSSEHLANKQTNKQEKESLLLLVPAQPDWWKLHQADNCSHPISAQPVPTSENTDGDTLQDQERSAEAAQVRQEAAGDGTQHSGPAAIPAQGTTSSW